MRRRVNNRLQSNQSGALLAQNLGMLAISIEEEPQLSTTPVAARARQAFDVERVTKKFYERFQKERARFLTFIEGISAQADREWYASLMLNRLMFVYFIQKKGLLAMSGRGQLDGDIEYLSHRLKTMQTQYGSDQFYSFYRSFLLRLFQEGLGKRERPAELDHLLGTVPYLNSGLFDVHVLERDYPDIQIADDAFERIFAFFDDYQWHLDNRPLRNDREINPDVLGYIFEKYINQKQMGAYYTKEDITEYIGKNTIIPYLLEATEQKCLSAFESDGPPWMLLRDDPGRYIYEAVKKGCELPLPAEIAVGMDDVRQRGEWNKAAPSEYALPTELWREVVARRRRYEEVRAKLANGEITAINDLITYNLDMRRFAEDVITYSEGVDLLSAFYESLEQVTILDPTCGSGAFLLAALSILEPLYEACLERMQEMVAEREQLDAADVKQRSSGSLARFRDILALVAKHPNRRYFILKSIIINNLYGVDIMEEATEICKLRLFLKLVAQIERFEDIEPLPDIDFTIRAGNALVGFASYAEAERAITSTLDFEHAMERIECKVQAVECSFEHFRSMQTAMKIEAELMAEVKEQLRSQLKDLGGELDRYLAAEYGIDEATIANKEAYAEKFEQWRVSHQPFHWFVEFYDILKHGGFAVIIGNPPYVEYYERNFSYRLRDFATLACANLYTCVIERSAMLLVERGFQGMILPLAAFATRNCLPLIEGFRRWFPCHWSSFYHFRPAMLFSGGKVANIPTTISIAKKGGEEDGQQYSTNVMKWSAEHRDVLFPSLCYIRVMTARDPDNRHYVAKYGSSIENSIMEKMLTQRTVGSYLSGRPNQNTMYYRSAGGLYWKVFVTFAWPYHTTSNKTCSWREEYKREVFVAVLNSSLFWWYYTVTFDTFNVKDYMLFGFRFSYPEEDVATELQACCQRLMEDFQRHAKHLMRGKTGSYTLYARRSKSIIDDIDRVLARHYGLTDEELDFIINYDIKYRMGQGDWEEGEE